MQVGESTIERTATNASWGVNDRTDSYHCKLGNQRQNGQLPMQVGESTIERTATNAKRGDLLFAYWVIL